MKKIFVLTGLLLFSLCANASHLHKEKYYQNIWCRENNGILEYVLDDTTRVDCLTKTHAIEFDFASKWAESVGQSLYYAKKTGKAPGIVLILEDTSDEKYYDRAKVLADNYNISLWKMKSENVKSANIDEFDINDIIENIISWILGIFKNFLVNSLTI